jgi:SAM-dependent methyltransferase
MRAEAARIRPAGGRATLRLLDLCCGTGNHLAHLLRGIPDLQATGVDLSQAMLRIARRKCRSRMPIRWLCGDAEQALAVMPPASQDLVLISNALYAQPRQADLLRRIRRVICPVGALVLTDPLRAASLLTLLVEHVRARGPGGLHVLPLLCPSFGVSLFLERDSRHTFSSPQRVRILLQDAGFVIHHESRTYGRVNYLLIAHPRGVQPPARRGPPTNSDQ